MCCSRWRCGTRRRCEMQRRRSSACCAYRCERDAARRGCPRENQADVGLFCGAFLHGKPLGPGRGDCAVGGGGVRRGRPRRTLLREGAFAYPIVGFLLVYNVAASGWLAGIAVALRLLLLVWASLLLMALSTPAELSEALRRLFSPLGRLGLPVRDFATSLSIALRFMPLFSEELGAVRAAQASRGAAFEDAGLVRRLRAYGGLMVPVLVGLFRRADRLAAAMEARCYGASGEPTSLVERRFSSGDGAVLLVGVAACRLRARSLGGSQRGSASSSLAIRTLRDPRMPSGSFVSVASRALPVSVPARLRGWRRR